MKSFLITFLSRTVHDLFLKRGPFPKLEDSFSPWDSSSTRLTELSIEQHFGRLRMTQSSAELNTETFCRTSARMILGDVIQKAKSYAKSRAFKPSKVPAVSDKQPLHISTYSMFYCFTVICFL